MKRFLFSALLLAGTLSYAQINLGSGTSTGLAPVHTFTSYSYSQQIISKDDILASPGGAISAITFYQSASAQINKSNNWTVYLAHTDKTKFDSAADWIPVSQLTNVYSGLVSTAGGKVTVTFAAPFPYDNTKNLVLAVDENADGYDTSTSYRFYNYAAGAGTALYYKNDFTNPNPASPPSGTLYDQRSRMTLEGLYKADTGTCPTVTAPAAGATGQSVTPTFTWNSVSGATTYLLNVGTTAGAGNVVNGLDMGNVTSYKLTNPLNYLTTYYYTVQAKTASGLSTACNVRSFTTTGAPPANDACFSAVSADVIPFSYTQNDGAYATNNGGFVTTCGSGMNDGLWFNFTGTGGPVTVTATPTTAWDLELAVLKGACGEFSCAGSADANTTGKPETVTVTTVAGASYYINVGSYSSVTDSPEGNFTLSITNATLQTADAVKAVAKISPNPFKDFIKVSNSEQVEQITVTDFSGRKVAEFRGAETVDLHHLARGIYMISLQMKDGSSKAYKIEKQ